MLIRVWEIRHDEKGFYPSFHKKFNLLHLAFDTIPQIILMFRLAPTVAETEENYCFSTLLTIDKELIYRFGVMFVFVNFLELCLCFVNFLNIEALLIRRWFECFI